MTQKTQNQTHGNNHNGATPAGKTHAYPLMENAAEELTAASGRKISSVNLDAAAAGEVAADDLQVSAATLRAQAEVAAQAGYRELAQNLQRAAELTAVPNEELLRMYEVMRPGRSSFAELTEMAEKLEGQYNAPITAGFVRDAAEVYQKRSLLRRA